MCIVRNSNNNLNQKSKVSRLPGKKLFPRSEEAPSPLPLFQCCHAVANFSFSIFFQAPGPRLLSAIINPMHHVNSTVQYFNTRFISLFRKRREALHREHLEMSASLKTIERGSMLADKLKNQLQHEKMILEQKEEVAMFL